MEHPEAVVQVALPYELYVLGVGTYLANSDGSMDDTPCKDGVHLLVLSIGHLL